MDQISENKNRILYSISWEHVNTFKHQVAHIILHRHISHFFVGPHGVLNKIAIGETSNWCVPLIAIMSVLHQESAKAAPPATSRDSWLADIPAEAALADIITFSLRWAVREVCKIGRSSDEILWSWLAGAPRRSSTGVGGNLFVSSIVICEVRYENIISG